MMATGKTLFFSILLALTASQADAHIAAFAKGMYCRNGNNASEVNQNSNAPISPLFDLPKEQWWMQADRHCDQFPPPAGEFLDIPAGSSFTVELAANQAFTTLSYDGKKAGEWPDGNDHPEDWHGDWDGSECLPGGGYMHTQNQSMAAGTAWAISYHPLEEVTLENLVVFSVLQHTPWKRLATYQAPAGLPACPESGCTCTWLWIPNGCGQSNMYMQPYKCRVTGATSTVPLAKAQPPVYCKDEPSKCVTGAKQMIAWQQATGNNIVTPGRFSPAYSEICGFEAGAQNDIFDSAAPASGSSSSTVVQPSTTSGPTTIPAPLSTLATSTRPINPPHSGGCRAHRK